MAENNEGKEPEVKNIPDMGLPADGATRPDPKNIEDEGKQVADKSADKSNEDNGKKPEEEASKEKTQEELDAEQKNEDGSWKDEYVTIENEHATAAIELLKEANVSPLEANDIFKDAIDSNDLTKVDWSRLEKRIGKSKAALVKAGVEKYHSEAFDEAYKTQQKGFEMFGGEENWKTVAKHFQTAEKKDPVLKAKVDELRKGLDAGGWFAEQALKELKSMYEADPNTKGLGTSKQTRGDTVKDTSFKPISKTEYYEQIAKSERENWPREKREELNARRRVSIQKEMGS